MTAISVRPGGLRLALSIRMLIASILTGLTMMAGAAQAHLFLASEASVYFDRDAQNFALQVNLNLEAILAGVDPMVKDTNDSPKAAEYNRLRALPPAELEQLFKQFQPTFLQGVHFLINGQPIQPEIASVDYPEVGDLSLPRKTIVHFRGQLPPDAKTFSFGWEPQFGKMLFRIMSAHSRRTSYAEVLEPGQMSTTFQIDDIRSRSRWEMIGDFMLIGFEHILPKGTDHILFVVGIYLLSTRWRPLLAQVTAFTVAHTITLGLGTKNIISLPSGIVEPLIAASIIYVAVENLRTSELSRWRPLVVFCFGLLHGLGFAGILRELTIAPEDFLVSLLSFNVGVELGQLAVIAICFLSFGYWFGKRSWYRQRIVVPGSLAIALVATYWFIQRVYDALA